jgi:hypothetical protein
MQLEETIPTVVNNLYFGPFLTSALQSGCGCGYGRAVRKVTAFLTETIWQKSSNQANYTPNR